jgi:uncharacterized protein
MHQLERGAHGPPVAGHLPHHSSSSSRATKIRAIVRTELELHEISASRPGERRKGRAPAGRACDTVVMELAADLTIDDTVLRTFCREHGIRSLRLFGSAARNELRHDSDIDLLVEFEPGRTPGLLGIAKLELELQELVGRDVDLRTVGDLSPYFRDDVIAAARVLYDAA